MKNLLKNAVALLLGLVVAFVLLEVALRVTHPVQFRVRGDKIFLPINQHVIIKNTEIPKLDKIIITSKNRIGFRGENPPNNFEDYLTIITVGGSTTEDFNLSDGKTWTANLGRELQQKFNKIWINNAGFGGHSTFGHIVLMEDYIVKIKPKVVLFLIGANDHGLKRYNAYEKFFFNKLDRNPIEAFIKEAAKKSEVLIYGVNIFRVMLAKQIGVYHQNLDLSKVGYLDVPQANIEAEKLEERKKYLDDYGQRVLKLIEICKSHGIVPVLITQPSLFGEGKDELTGVDLARVNTGRSSGKADWEVLERYNDVVRRVGRENQVLVISLDRELPHSSKYFYDWWHYTDAGSQRVSEIIYEHLYPYFAQRYKQYLINEPAAAVAR